MNRLNSKKDSGSLLKSQFQNDEVGVGYQAKHVVRQKTLSSSDYAQQKITVINDKFDFDTNDDNDARRKSDKEEEQKKSRRRKESSSPSSHKKKNKKKRKHKESSHDGKTENAQHNDLDKYLSCEVLCEFRKDLERYVQ